MTNFDLIPHYSVAPYGVTFFSRPEFGYSKNISESSLQNLKDNTNYYGDLSHNAQARLRKKINLMLYVTNNKTLKGREQLGKSIDSTIEISKGKKYNKSIKYKLTFITLTLPSKQIHTDNVIKKKCLNQFLVELRKLKPNCMYIWKAEKQDNGNIHFHILFNQYLKWQIIRTNWNRIINKLGYVDRYSDNQKEFFKNGFRMSINKEDKRTKDQQFKAYKVAKSCGWSNPNSTDVHALYKVKHLGAYISKYISKTVTKTIRTNTIKELLKDRQLLQLAKVENSKIDQNLTSHSSSFVVKEKNIIVINKELQRIDDELVKLREQGVKGRIWSCSSNLSRMKNYTDIGNESALVEFDIIQAITEKVIVNQIGKQQVVTLVFDLNKTPILKKEFDNHLESLQSQIVNPSLKPCLDTLRPRSVPDLVASVSPPLQLPFPRYA